MFDMENKEFFIVNNKPIEDEFYLLNWLANGPSKKPAYTHAEVLKIKKRRAKKKVAKASRKRNRHN